MSGGSTGEQSGQELRSVDERASEWLANTTEHVLSCVQADERLQRLRSDCQSIQETLSSLVLRLDRSGNFSGQEGLSTVNNRDFTALRNTVNESVKLNRSLGLELRHQRQQRNQDFSSMATRLEALERNVIHLGQVSYPA